MHRRAQQQFPPGETAALGPICAVLDRVNGFQRKGLRTVSTPHAPRGEAPLQNHQPDLVLTKRTTSLLAAA